ncbi:MAG: hypothetical protein C4524_04215 [Candidatus Zixiibacteriota bacterium]|nr:MAG: hypothetical protein C4524_04215 [candidate division Zixibacteria bacterium]
MPDKNEVFVEGLLRQVDHKELKTGMTMATAVLIHEAWWSRNKIRIPVKAFGVQADRLKEIPEGSPVMISGNVGGTTYRERDYPEVIVRTVWVGPRSEEGRPRVAVTGRDEDEDEELPF